ncbi:MAG: hypothetical protein ACI9G1_000322, partial [Pirellulaceae bacterium]
ERRANVDNRSPIDFGTTDSSTCNGIHEYSNRQLSVLSNGHERSSRNGDSSTAMRLVWPNDRT